MEINNNNNNIIEINIDNNNSNGDHHASIETDIFMLSAKYLSECDALLVVAGPSWSDVSKCFLIFELFECIF